MGTEFSDKSGGTAQASFYRTEGGHSIQFTGNYETVDGDNGPEKKALIIFNSGANEGYITRDGFATLERNSRKKEWSLLIDGMPETITPGKPLVPRTIVEKLAFAERVFPKRTSMKTYDW